MPDEYGGIELEDQWGGVAVEEESAPPPPRFNDELIAALPERERNRLELGSEMMAAKAEGEEAAKNWYRGIGPTILDFAKTTPEELQLQAEQSRAFVESPIGRATMPDRSARAPMAPGIPKSSIAPVMPSELRAPAEISEGEVMGAALQNQLLSGAGELASPESLLIMGATMGAGAIPKAGQLIQRGVTGYFGYEGIKHAVESIQALRDAKTPEERGRAIAGILEGTAIGVPASAHALRPARKLPKIEIPQEVKVTLPKAAAAAEEAVVRKVVEPDEVLAPSKEWTTSEHVPASEFQLRNMTPDQLMAHFEDAATAPVEQAAIAREMQSRLSEQRRGVSDAIQKTEAKAPIEEGAGVELRQEASTQEAPVKPKLVPVLVKDGKVLGAGMSHTEAARDTRAIINAERADNKINDQQAYERLNAVQEALDDVDAGHGMLDLNTGKVVELGPGRVQSPNLNPKEVAANLKELQEKGIKTEAPKADPLAQLRELPGTSNTSEAMALGKKVPPEAIPELEAIAKAAADDANKVMAEVDALPNPTEADLTRMSVAGNRSQLLTEAVEAAKGGEPAILARDKATNETAKTTEPMAAGEAQSQVRSTPTAGTGVPAEVSTGVPAAKAEPIATEVAKPAPNATSKPGSITEPELVGMGGEAAGEIKPAQLAQLTDSIKTLAETPKTTPARAFALGESMAGIKGSVQGALDGLKAAGSYLKTKLEGKPVWNDYKAAIGDRNLALSESVTNGRKWVRSVEKAIPDEQTRAAISNYVDMGGDAAQLARAASETKPQYKAGYERAQKLTPEEKTIADNLRNYFDSRLQEAIDAGILEDGIENYIHRIYEKESPFKKAAIAELRSGIFTGKPALAKERVFQYDLDAEKAGLKPIKDFAKRVTVYDLALNKAIADRKAVKDMMNITMSDGRPMIDVGGGGKVIKGEPVEIMPGVEFAPTKATLINRSQKRISEDETVNRGDYKPYDHPALRKWKWAAKDVGGNPIMVQGDVLIHPEAVRQINSIFGRSALRQNPVGRAALEVSGTIKQTMLDMSLFHQVQIGVHALEHRTFGPVKEIDFTNPDVRGLVRGGAVVGETTGYQAFSEGLHGSSLTKHIPWVGKRIAAYKDYLFSDFIPRIKVAMGLHALERNRSRFKDLSEDELYHLTANQMNAAFGELNYEMMGRNKTTQDALRLTLLAPDFLEARGRFAGQAGTVYGGLPHLREGKLTVGEQGNALLLGAVTMYIFARIANKMLNDEYHFEAKNAFNIVYKGKSYGLRTVQGDLIHAATDPGKFTNHRLNPLYGRPALEFLTGRDYFGRKRDTSDQLKDIAMTPIPISVRGAFSGQEQTLMESFLNSVGLVVKRDSPSSEISKLATEWKKDNKVKQEPGEFVYDAEKDPYRKIRLAAERMDEGSTRAEIAKAVTEGIAKDKIRQHFNISERHLFAGGKANEQKFIASLTADQKKLYEDARKERRRIRNMVLKTL